MENPFRTERLQRLDHVIRTALRQLDPRLVGDADDPEHGSPLTRALLKHPDQNLHVDLPVEDGVELLDLLTRAGLYEQQIDRMRDAIHERETRWRLLRQEHRTARTSSGKADVLRRNGITRTKADRARDSHLALADFYVQITTGHGQIVAPQLWERLEAVPPSQRLEMLIVDDPGLIDAPVSTLEAVRIVQRLYGHRTAAATCRLLERARAEWTQRGNAPFEVPNEATVNAG